MFLKEFLGSVPCFAGCCCVVTLRISIVIKGVLRARINLMIVCLIEFSHGGFRIRNALVDARILFTVVRHNRGFYALQPIRFRTSAIINHRRPERRNLSNRRKRHFPAPAKPYHADPIAADIGKDAQILNSCLSIFRNILPWRQFTDIRQSGSLRLALACRRDATGSRGLKLHSPLWQSVDTSRMWSVSPAFS